MHNGDRVLRLLAIASALCAFAATGILVRATLVQPNEVPGRSVRAPEETKNWTTLLASGWRIGPVDAPIVVMEFGDYQCPFCRRFEEQTFPTIAAAFPGKVAMIYKHFPLPHHPEAYRAARGAECAGDQGRFEAFHKLLYEKQDSIGKKDYLELATESGVPDSAMFSACIAETEPHRRIEADIAEAQKLGATGTPTVIVDGLRFFSSPDTATLVRTIRERLNRKRNR